MNSESASARRRRRIYHQRSSHQSSGGSLSGYSQTLIPEEAEDGEGVGKGGEVEEEQEEEEEDEEMNNEHTSLIRASSSGGCGDSSPQFRGRHRRQRLHSAGSGECQYLEVGQEEEDGTQRVQPQEEWRTSVVIVSQPQRRGSPGAPHHRHYYHQTSSPTAGRVVGGTSVGGAVQRQQQYQRGEQEDAAKNAGMTIPPAGSSHHHHVGISSSGGGSGRAAWQATTAQTSAATVTSTSQHGAGLAFSSSGRLMGTGTAGAGYAPTHTPTGGASFTAPGGGAGGVTLHTPVVKKRTRFHQRSVTMMPATSPVLGHRYSGSVDEVGDRHHQLDLAATYHGGGSHRGNNQRGKHHHTATTVRQHSATKTSTPSLLFTKVKERIREKVFQSSEWPNAAAMMHEKRQRANDMLEASLNTRTNLNLEQIQLHGKQRKRTTHTLRCKSDPTGSKAGGSQPALQAEPLVVAPSADHDPGSPQEAGSPNTDEMRHAFRRRSISEDTYDRQPCVIMKKNGVVCSNEDLEVIMQDQQSIQHSKAYKKHRSPRPLKKHLRTQSLDIARLTAHDNATTSGPCCHSSIYLEPQVSMESSSSTVSSIHTIDSASSEINLALRSSSLALDANGCRDVLASPSTHLYPEIVLDDKSKETIMEERKDGSQSPEDNVSIKDETTKSDGKSKKNKPVPEIVFDENGQTWDVYGAEFDPEVLGVAIQRHLEKMMERMMAPVMEAAADVDTGDDAGDGTTTGDNEGRVEKSSSEPNSFWVRLLCLFAGRSDVAT